MKLSRTPILLSLSMIVGLAAASDTESTHALTRDVDPLALKVLQAVAEPVEQAQTFSFKALVAEEQQATNGQIVTFFHTVDISVRRPDKLRLSFRRSMQHIDLYKDGSQVTLYSPETKLYSVIPAQGTIDATLDELDRRKVDIPVGPFLRTDLYEFASSAVQTGYVIGRVSLFGEEVHQLAFSGRNSDFQLWVTGGDKPRFIRAEIVNKKLPGKPRTTIQFLDWNLSPQLAANEFTFVKAPDATEITFRP